MSTITFTIHEDGRDYWTKKYEVELDTEDYEDFDEMQDAALEMVQDGEVEPYDDDVRDGDSDGPEVDDHDYDEDEPDNYEWKQPEEVAPAVAPGEELIKW